MRPPDADSPRADEGFELIYRNTRLWRLRFLQLVFWGPAVFFAWLAWATRIDDPTNNHVASLVLSPVSALFAVMIEIYIRQYATAVWRTKDAMRIESMSTFGRIVQTFPMANVTFGRERRSNPYATRAATGFWLDNSYSTIRVHGRRLPFILDTTAERPGQM
ncbi:MAG: hypothetical protein LCH88_09435 [Proteobacteria bacterium]|nr:hypothetical protein [Pseudomonadota bacterium]